MSKQKKRIMAITLIGVLLCVVSLLALHVGTIMIPIGGGIQSILNGMGIPVHFTTPITAEQEAVLWFIRMPRLIIGLLVGGALALAGAVMQGVFSNPLADPGIMGVSRCRYRYCTRGNISRHVLHARLCLCRGLCICWDYYSFDLAQ